MKDPKDKFQRLVDDHYRGWIEEAKGWEKAARYALSGPGGGCAMMLALERSRDSINRSLFDEYGITFREDPQLGWVWTAPSRPLTPHESWIVKTRKPRWVVDNTALGLAVWVLDHQILVPGEDAFRRPVEAIVQVMKTTAIAFAPLLDDSDPDVRTSALAAVTGYLGSKIKLGGKEGTRLREALATSGKDHRDELLRELPVAILTAWAERNRDEPLITELRAVGLNAARIVERDLRPERFHERVAASMEELEGEPLAKTPPPDADLEAREMAAHQEVTAREKLTDGEWEIFEAIKRRIETTGQEPTAPEISRLLDGRRSPEVIRQFLHRIRTKLGSGPDQWF
jgi:hypothetical protein